MNIYIQIYKIKQMNRVMIYAAKKHASMKFILFENKNLRSTIPLKENIFRLRFVQMDKIKNTAQTIVAVIAAKINNK